MTGRGLSPCRAYIVPDSGTMTCEKPWPHGGQHQANGHAWTQPAPLTCALCGSNRWNDETVSWLPLHGDDRRPYCAGDCDQAVLHA